MTKWPSYIKKQPVVSSDYQADRSGEMRFYIYIYIYIHTHICWFQQSILKNSHDSLVDKLVKQSSILTIHSTEQPPPRNMHHSLSGLSLYFAYVSQHLLHLDELLVSLPISPGVSTWRRQWHPTPVLLPGKSHGRRHLVGCSPWGREESDTTDRLHFHFSLSCTGEGNGNPLQCSCLENPRDGGAWWAAVYGVAQSRHDWSKWAAAAALCRCVPWCLQWLDDKLEKPAVSTTQCFSLLHALSNVFSAMTWLQIDPGGRFINAPDGPGREKKVNAIDGRIKIQTILTAQHSGPKTKLVVPVQAGWGHFETSSRPWDLPWQPSTWNRAGCRLWPQGSSEHTVPRVMQS